MHAKGVMAKALSIACWLAILAAPAWADRVQLADGRSFTGVVTVEGDSVQVVMEYGTIRLNRAEVVSIELGDTPEVELGKRLAAVPADNPTALCEVAKWAAQNNLPRQADDLYNKVLKLDPDHAAARAALDYVKLDGEWRTFAQALDLARNKLEAGQHQALLSAVLPALQPLARTKDRLLALRELEGLCQLRAARIASAAKTFDELAAKSAGAGAIRFGAIAEILKENADGMYILTEPYPPVGELLGGTEPAVKAGPASLTDPRVLQAALADRAKKDIQTARQTLDEIRMVGDSETVKAKGPLAGRSLDRAEAMAPGIARSYRIELVRLRIEVLRKEVDQQAKDFDKELASLGKSDLAVPDYRRKVQKLLSVLDAIRDDLKEITDVSKPYPRELLLDVKWAEVDIVKIKEMRDVLIGELDVKR
jgi:hypothetical protein